MKFKYIRIHNGSRDQIILWPMSDWIFHSHIYSACQNEEAHKLISAGFAEISNSSVKCYGRSESLSCNSKPIEDAIIILEQLGIQTSGGL